ncbi:hypothetical protein LJC02_01815 [Breznakia sp. OttesenSCG-928-G09]|nr:hypothetical protein [Breznakia sp. OttesenSCG-928-G09]
MLMIISQDKMTHFPYGIGCIKFMQSQYHDMNWVIFFDEEIMGKYSTKEKALNVMDMIKQHFLVNNDNFGSVGYSSEWSGSINTSINSVFEMPQDNEVE